jgi:hypothetical protein
MDACTLHMLVLGIFVLVILIPSVAKERASLEFIFTHFNADNGMGIHDKAYILAVGLLMSQYSLIGYDACLHTWYVSYPFD